MSLAVFVYLILKHYLLGDIVGNHSLCGAFSRKLGKIIVRGIVMDILLLSGSLVILGNLLSDILCALVDPRIRVEGD